MVLRGKVKKWGNSLGLRLPKAVVAQLGLGEDTAVEFRIKGNRLLITPAAPAYTLKGLLARVSRKNVHTELAGSAPAGHELW
ncbi:MAG: hypothetical protein A3F83_09655 [Candidatus Glassbacteria bacterium RIFCSPLOWO2_12_FULL_58_11]|uniref:SpoVT-AbrB domain-containing protein n=1 Tax=Candidatus Glassbacteria bacterium RIFCSPLOWO2_12_FULL_58_11 TaxID=1817867 RepID=A0A1F5YJX7_9BACT|nr:MAG: hypothetical protein A3F83_09655 [Candidatus Glassbacteria bacterium RIFCSPLOWO2_12_FULL_58_11]